MLYKILLFIGVLSAMSGCSQPKDVAYVTPHCLVGQSQCHIATHAGDMQLLFNVERLVAETPFSMFVIFEQSEQIKQLSGYMEGLDMFMGKIPLFFEKDDQNRHVTQSLFGSCASESMRWRLWLTVEFEDGTKQQHFIDVDSYRR